MGFVSLCQIWDFCEYSLNTLKYPKMGIRYFFLCKNASMELAILQLKLSHCAGIQTINLQFCGENVSPVTLKVQEEDCNVTVVSFSETIKYNATCSLCDCPRKGSNKLAKNFQHHQSRNVSERRTFGSCSYTLYLSEI